MEYIYIIRQPGHPACKIGVTQRAPEERLKEHNASTGVTKDSEFQLLYAAEVQDCFRLEKELRKEFGHLLVDAKKELYFFNTGLLASYVDYISRHPDFLKDRKTGKTIRDAVRKKKKESFPETTMAPQQRLLESQRKARAIRKHQESMFGTVEDYKNKFPADEYYTKLEDIEKEIAFYPVEIWKDKTVFCNCDDVVGDEQNTVDSSAFAVYFLRNFRRLGLRKLICTHYDGGWESRYKREPGYVFTKHGCLRIEESKDFPKNYNGDFRHQYSIQLLKESDIVCTNPPFSMVKAFVSLLFEHKKQFLFIANNQSVHHTWLIPHVASGKIKPGTDYVNTFITADNQEREAPAHWYTNLPMDRDRPSTARLKFVPLADIPEKYRYTDDSGTLTCMNGYIPVDYEPSFAVPTDTVLKGILEKGYRVALSKEYIPFLNGKKKNGRLLIQKLP